MLFIFIGKLFGYEKQREKQLALERESKIRGSMKKKIRNIGFMLVLAGIVFSCKVGPNYQEPEEKPLRLLDIQIMQRIVLLI